MRTRLLLAGVALTTSVAGLAPAEAATPRPVAVTQCGQTITQDAYLARNLTCDTDFGIRLGAPPSDDEPEPSASATLDLRGHRLRGSGSGIGIVSDLGGGSADLTVRNGRVEGWEEGLFQGSAGHLTATRLRIDRNTTRGVWCTSNCVVRRSTITENGIGTWQTEALMTLTDNRISGNTTGSELVGLTSGTYSRNSYRHNDVGVRVTIGDVTLVDNSFEGNGTGVLTQQDGSGSASLRDNRFVRNGDGVYFPSPAYVELQRNSAVHNTRYGFYAPDANDLGGNTASHNGQACVGVECSEP